jgi:hypothetical protein
MQDDEMGRARSIYGEAKSYRISAKHVGEISHFEDEHTKRLLK